jgi:acyl-coenzyme A thioesterase 9
MKSALQTSIHRLSNRQGHIEINCGRFQPNQCYSPPLRRGCARSAADCRLSRHRCFSDRVGDPPPVSVSLFKNPIVHELWTARQRAKQEFKAAQQQQRQRQENCAITKSPADSRVQVSYPFSTDALLWETYRSPWGQMRLGKLLEDLDALAGNIAFFHVHTDNRAEEDYPVIVTASVDRIRLHERPLEGSDQHLSGQVTWTGTSSMEIRMQCTDAGSDQEWVEAYVTFVTLDPHTKKPMHIPAVVPVTDEEKAEYSAGAARAAAKKRRRKQHPPALHDVCNVDAKAASLLAEAGPLLTMPSLADPHSILLKDTAMQNAMIAQPQVQNLHNRIFGGFLMRRAFELAFSNAYLFGGARPIFLEVDEVSFTSPVDVGDLLVFHSRVLFTENHAGNLHDYYQQETNIKNKSNPVVALMHIEVEAWVTEPEKVSARMSNQFYFTFAVAIQGEGRSPRVRKVLPSNIDEARRMAMRMHVEEDQSKS